MHGKTYLGEKLKGKAEWALGNDSDFYRIPKFPNKDSSFNDDILGVTGNKHPDHIAGIILESYRGWDAKFMPRKYVKEVMAFAKKHNIPVCFDEIQGGFWRTGKLFSYEHYDIEPDLICVGKGLGGGIPISAVLGKAYLLDSADDLTSTFAGNTLCCASDLGNLSNLEKIDKEYLRVKELLMFFRLRKLKKKYLIISKVRSKGLLGAIIFDKVSTATKLCKLAEERGLLLVYTGKRSVKLGPPLTISTEVLLQACDIIEECIKELK